MKHINRNLKGLGAVRSHVIPVGKGEVVHAASCLCLCRPVDQSDDVWAHNTVDGLTEVIEDAGGRDTEVTWIVVAEVVPH